MRDGLQGERAGEGAAGEPSDFTMLTTAPGPDVVPYHDRQVAVLPPADWLAWINLTRPERISCDRLPPARSRSRRRGRVKPRSPGPSYVDCRLIAIIVGLLPSFGAAALAPTIKQRQRSGGQLTYGPAAVGAFSFDPTGRP
jgi:hypothetical protein